MLPVRHSLVVLYNVSRTCDSTHNAPQPTKTHILTSPHDDLSPIRANDDHGNGLQTSATGRAQVSARREYSRLCPVGPGFGYAITCAGLCISILLQSIPRTAYGMGQADTLVGHQAAWPGLGTYWSALCIVLVLSCAAFTCPCIKSFPSLQGEVWKCDPPGAAAMHLAPPRSTDTQTSYPDPRWAPTEEAL